MSVQSQEELFDDSEQNSPFNDFDGFSYIEEENSPR